ncbi:complement C4-like [Centropristis striata]|uniref:complement C4-like n=1 Tax=Centropristis striata TaxID=184440 RepID=UPI0027DF80CE|nr:complement C4-like [Centropristis striata]
MERRIFSILFLLIAVESASSVDNGFFISAPTVFHVGVKEKVLVQMSNLNSPVTLYLKHGSSDNRLSAEKTVQCSEQERIKTVELMLDREKVSRLPPQTLNYVTLKAESPSFSIPKSTFVTVSKRRGNIFIQTDQPIYNPTQRVKYRIFTLDHKFRPHMDVVRISVINAAGNRVMKSLKTAKGGVIRDSFSIPDVAKMGTWKIKAHYDEDYEANAASLEFKVKQFVLPSFEVNIKPEESYILLNAEQFNFTISASYSHGEKVKGAYHCTFGLVQKSNVSRSGLNMKPDVIRGLTLTGSVKDGTATASFQIQHLQNQLKRTLSEIQQSGAQLYLGVFVTNIQSGEIQEAEVYLPIISHKYTMDFSRTRSYFIPGYPLDVVAIIRLPDGSRAAGEAVKIDVPESTEKSWQGTTDQEGTVFTTFNIPDAAPITVEGSVGDLMQKKVLQRASSPSNSYLYLSLTNRIYSVGESLTVNYHSSTNGPGQGFIYYMVLSRGIVVQKGSLRFGTHVRGNLLITSDMVPSFRLIGYYHTQGGDIIADSVWLDVRDECEIKVKVEHKGTFNPGNPARLDFDLHGQNAKVALLAVDKAIYALNADNKLRAKQVFSTMQSHDLGCSPSGGGADPASVLTDAGLSFISQSKAEWKRSLGCKESVRQRRAVDLQQEMMTLKSNFSENLQECCVRGFSLIPMTRTCQERANRVSLVEPNPDCADVFLQCCHEGERLRQKKIQEDAQNGLGRTEISEEFEEFLLDASQYIRRIFTPSIAFTEIDIRGKGSYHLNLPDSITTWEVQVITLSEATGFCVVKPSEVRAFKKVFVSLRLPYSVRKFEQLSISPVIYNYGDNSLKVAVHMEQTEGLCSPGSATSMAFVNITLAPQSSQFVSFSAVPMESGSIPIKIRLYDMENEWGIDAIEKPLNVMTEGLEKREESTKVFKLDGKSINSVMIDGFFPDDTVPDSSTNIFISVEGAGFGSSHAKNLLSPEKVASLIVLPGGCLEQTTRTLIPTVSALRYLDLSDLWFELPPGKRDETLDKLEKGYRRILYFKDKGQGYYRSFHSAPASYWATALIVKVLSLVAERQTVAFGDQGRRAWAVDLEEIRHPVSFLLLVQNTDGSFNDPHQVLYRRVLKGNDQKASITAFITLALHRSLQFLPTGLKNSAEAGISKSTRFLLSNLNELQHPYAVAITAYCLGLCLPEGTNHSSTWKKLEAHATKGKNGCYLWTTNPSEQNQANADASTVESTAYALLAAVELGQMKWAEETVCWLTTQENYHGGFKSTQDTMVALEALAEHELRRPDRPATNLIAEFTVKGRNDIVTLQLENKKEKVETDLKKFTGNNINVQLTGQGETKLKVVKAYYLLAPKGDCDKVSINVTVTGKVKYTAKVIENYEYYDDYANANEEVVEKEVRMPRSAIERFDARTRNRRDVDNNLNSDGTVSYTICVRHSLHINLTGMAIADITLLSGFEAEIQDLEKLKEEPERYISHYETSYGRVVLYFDELVNSEECISFGAKQLVPIGLLQPAPAVFYDYYEPNRKCTVFYSAPQRSKMVSTLCSEDVCQCAERPCHKIQNTIDNKRTQRTEHACFAPIVDYAYIVEVFDVSTKSNFELYRVTVKDVLRAHGDELVEENSVRVFAKRFHCKGKLDLNTQYLIMGKDGATTDSSGSMQYLLESNTWVEKKPSEEDCKATAMKAGCRQFNAFTDAYKLNGCTQ